MTEFNHNPMTNESSQIESVPSEIEQAVTRVSSLCGGPGDFALLRARTADPAMLDLIDALELRGGLADGIDLVAPDLAPPAPSRDPRDEPAETPGAGGPGRPTLAAAGWAVAAMVTIGSALLLKQGEVNHAPSRDTSGHTIQMVDVALNPDADLARYIDSGVRLGRVVRELPLELVSVSAWPAGGVEVVYERRILERTTVDEVRTWAVDEFGSPVLGERLDIPDLVPGQSESAG